MLLSLYFIFNILLVNKFFPVTEGWFQDYSRYILNGEFIYRDFYVPVPIGFVYLTSFLNYFFNDKFILFRLYGIAERLLLIYMLWRIFSKIYSPQKVFIALLTASIIYISNIQDVFFGYYQSSLLFSVFALFFVVKMIENVEDRKVYYYSMAFGMTSALSFSFKQTIGGLLPVVLGLVFVILTFDKNKKKAIISGFISLTSALIVLGVIGIYLYYNNALDSFFNQIFIGAQSKGSMSNIFFAFIPRMISRRSIIIFLCIASYWIALKSCYSNNSIAKKISLGLIVIIPLLFLFYAFILQINISLISNIGWKTKMVFSIGLLVTMFIFNRTINTDGVKYNLIYSFSLSLYFLIICFYTNTHIVDFTNFMNVRASRQDIIYALFFWNGIWCLKELYLSLQTHRNDNAIKTIIIMTSFMLMYTHGLSYIVEDHGTLLLFTLIICEILSFNVPLPVIKNCSICLFCFLTIFNIAVQRNNFPYHWWGVNALPPVQKSQYWYDDPKLVGFKGEYNYVKTMNYIYNLIKKNKKYGDSMYTFPHINYFNVMSNMNSPTFAKVHYFDVCPESVVKQDVAILKKEKPTFIIYMKFNESEWKIHEKAFRNGNKSGQRDIEQFVSESLHNGSYIKLGIFILAHSDPIYILGRNDGRNWKN